MVDAGPFSSVGVDIFGPFYVTVRRSQVKRYGCIFSCFTSRAVHVAKIADLSADAFIKCLIRFISRLGHAQLVRSDSGTNLVGVRNELDRCFHQLNCNEVIRAAHCHNIEWVLNTPLASHHDGLWERIRTIRWVLFSVLKYMVKWWCFDHSLLWGCKYHK